MGLRESKEAGLEYLQLLEIKEKKAGELLANKRVCCVLKKIMEEVERPESLPKEEKKLVCKVLEQAQSAEAAEKYIRLVKLSKIKTETDIKNAESVLKKAPEASVEELALQMQRNVPSAEEMERIAGEVMQEHLDKPRAQVLRELKHHPRLACVPSKKILDLLARLEIRRKEEDAGAPKGVEAVPGKGLSEKDAQELLDLATSPQPFTRDINRKYQKLAVPDDLYTSRDRKWTRYLEGEMQTMHTPFTNYQKTPEILREHIKRTKGQVRVRFPPEPNGHLHIGHAKAMSINFGYRDFYRGWISLRYDDTNPRSEKAVHYEKIREMVGWMGYTPDAVTCASDYFGRLYECAVELIKRGKAYVCHLSRKEASDKRKEAMTFRHALCSEDKVVSPWRNRPVAENLEHFQRMKEGKYGEGEAVLRMKMDMASDNPQMWDLVAYRVVKHPHCRTGDAWVIYPSYDFTHCLTDSFEDITHSFCTTEFINSRESYNWLCDALDLYRPVQWEYSRLCIAGSLLSKRFIAKAIDEKAFVGWDDPRLSTLEGLRNRGVPAHSIRRFVEALGITTAASELSPLLLENIVREDLSGSAKATAVLTPLLIRVPQKAVLVDAKDFRDGAPSASFYRIQEGSTVFLKGLGPLKLADSASRRLEKSEGSHNAVIPWLETDAPAAVLEVVRGEEILEYKEARVSPEAAKSPIGAYWQFIRIGFFVRVKDKDSKLRFRMVVPLKLSPLLEEAPAAAEAPRVK